MSASPVRFACVVLAFAAGCGGTATGETTPPEPTVSVAAAVDGRAPNGPALDKDLAALAGSPAVIKMKIRTDANGSIVKQAVYHNNANALPKPVVEATQKAFPGAKPRRYESELYADLGRIFEIEVDTSDGRQCELAARADGTKMYTECHIEVGSLPVPVADTVNQTIPGGKILEAEQKQGPKIDEFTVEVELSGKEFYLRIRPDGTLIEKLARIPAMIEIPVP